MGARRRIRRTTQHGPYEASHRGQRAEMCVCAVYTTAAVHNVGEPRRGLVRRAHGRSPARQPHAPLQLRKFLRFIDQTTLVHFTLDSNPAEVAT